MLSRRVSASDERSRKIRSSRQSSPRLASTAVGSDCTCILVLPGSSLSASEAEGSGAVQQLTQRRPTAYTQGRTLSMPWVTWSRDGDHNGPAGATRPTCAAGLGTVTVRGARKVKIDFKPVCHERGAQGWVPKRIAL